MIDLASAAPGPGLATALANADPRDLDPGELVDALIGFERVAGWVAAAQACILAKLGPSLIDGGDDWLREEVGAALRLSPQTAQQRIDTARDLCGRLPGILAALSTGQISYLHAVIIAEATHDLAAPAVAAVEDRVLARAASQTVAEFRRAVTRAVLLADPAQAEQAHQHAVAQRTVRTWSMPDGMAEIRALLDAPEAAMVMATVNALAAKTDARDPRSIDARRADALMSVFAGAVEQQGPSQGQRIRAQIQVTVPATTLLGLSEAPGDLAGYGPITAGVARELAATGPWRRLVIHPATGQLLDYGRRSYAPHRASTWPRLLSDPISAESLDYGRRAYRPPAKLAQFVIARDRVCQFPGCNHPASRCDLDHRTPWQHGGTTCPGNLTALCRRHHRAKHGPWILRHNPDGSITWISPTGKQYRQPPPSYDDP